MLVPSVVAKLLQLYTNLCTHGKKLHSADSD
jgi:hypothetical protein